MREVPKPKVEATKGDLSQLQQEKSIMLVPLSPQQVLEDQRKIQSEVERKVNEGKVEGMSAEGKVERTTESLSEKSEHEGKKSGEFPREEIECEVERRQECNEPKPSEERKTYREAILSSNITKSFSSVVLSSFQELRGNELQESSELLPIKEVGVPNILSHVPCIKPTKEVEKEQFEVSPSDFICKSLPNIVSYPMFQGDEINATPTKAIECKGENFVVPKEDTWRLSPTTVMYFFLTPRYDVVLHENLKQCVFACNVILKNGFHETRLREGSKHETLTKYGFKASNSLVLSNPLWNCLSFSKEKSVLVSFVFEFVCFASISHYFVLPQVKSTSLEFFMHKFVLTHALHTSLIHIHVQPIFVCQSLISSKHFFILTHALHKLLSIDIFALCPNLKVFILSENSGFKFSLLRRYVESFVLCHIPFTNFMHCCAYTCKNKFATELVSLNPIYSNLVSFKMLRIFVKFMHHCFVISLGHIVFNSCLFEWPMQTIVLTCITCVFHNHNTFVSLGPFVLSAYSIPKVNYSYTFSSYGNNVFEMAKAMKVMPRVKMKIVQTFRFFVLIASNFVFDPGGIKIIIAFGYWFRFFTRLKLHTQAFHAIGAYVKGKCLCVDYFIVIDSIPFSNAGFDSRTNPSKEGGADMIKEGTTKDGKDPLKITSGPLTRKKAKELTSALQARMLTDWRCSGGKIIS